MRGRAVLRQLGRASTPQQALQSLRANDGRGTSRYVADRFGVSVRTAQRWLAGTQRSRNPGPVMAAADPGRRPPLRRPPHQRPSLRRHLPRRHPLRRQPHRRHLFRRQPLRRRPLRRPPQRRPPLRRHLPRHPPLRRPPLRRQPQLRPPRERPGGIGRLAGRGGTGLDNPTRKSREVRGPRIPVPDEEGLMPGLDYGQPVVCQGCPYLRGRWMSSAPCGMPPLAPARTWPTFLVLTLKSSAGRLVPPRCGRWAWRGTGWSWCSLSCGVGVGQ